MKKFLSALACILLVGMLTGCGSEADPIVDENGDIIHWSEEEMPEGYTILKDDGYYYKILPVSTNTDNNGNLYIWFTEEYDQGIPHFTAKDKLMYYSETSRPQGLTFYKLTDYNYTLGIMFSVTNNTGDLKYPQIIGFSGTYNGTSQVGSVVSGAVTDGATTYITGINNHEFTSSLLVDNSFLKGLTKDTMYQLEMYCGTVKKTVNIKADTHLYLQEATYATSSYEELKAKCFEITLPSNMAPGYYYADGIGMFYYEGTITDIDEDDIDKIIQQNDDSSAETLEEVEGDYDEDKQEELTSLPESDVAEETNALEDFTYGEESDVEYVNEEEETEDVEGDYDNPEDVEDVEE